MNKKLIAMAIATAVSLPVVAQADVTVYGRVQAEYTVEDFDNQDSIQTVDDNAGQSRLGVKFKEKLGGGLTAFGKVEFRIDPAQSSASGTNGTASDNNISGALGQRDAFVGIKGSWGSIAAGSFHAPYKTTGGVKWDPWTATHLQARRAGGMSGGTGIGGHNGFMRNAIYYTSPNINGFEARFAISPDETNPGAANGDTTGNEQRGDADGGDNDYSLALSYKNGPWHAIFAHNRNNINNGDDETLTKVGLRWKQGNHTVQGQYESIDDASAANAGATPGSGGAGGSNAATGGVYRVCGGCDADIYWLNYQFQAGNNIFAISYGNTDVDRSGASDYDHDYWAVGVIHKFSKKTRIFGGYTETDGDDDAASGRGRNDRDAFTVGIRKDF